MSINFEYTEDGLVLYIDEEDGLIIDITDEYLSNTFPDIDSTNRKPIVVIKNSNIKSINIDKEISYITVSGCEIVNFHLKSKRKHMVYISNSTISRLVVECEKSVIIILETSNIKFIIDNIGFSIRDLYITSSKIQIISSIYINLLNVDSSYITKLIMPYIKKIHLSDSKVIGLNKTIRVSDEAYQYNIDRIDYGVIRYISKYIV